MAKPIGGKHVEDLVSRTMFPIFMAERENLDRIDKWARWDHDQPHAPRQSTREYKELSARSETPYLGLVVTAVVQALYVESYRSSDASENASPWGYWQANKMDARQIAVHHAATQYGLAYGTVLPGRDAFGTSMPVMRGHSPRRMVAVYDDPAGDDWPQFALQADPSKVDGSEGWRLRLIADEFVYRLLADSGGRITFIDHLEHGQGVCPVVRFTNNADLEGRTPGEVEPFIPVAARIDQTTFDRLVVQRFSSWVVRTIAGMSVSDTINETGETPDAAKLRLKVEDLLVAADPDTKFGSLPATPLDGFIKAKDADIRDLAAVTQTPPHHLLGAIANLSAEALAAAEAGLMRKVDQRKHAYGESWEQMLRLAAHVAGDTAAAQDTSAQVRWKDTESRSLAQAADALVKLHDMGVPIELLLEKIPGWTKQDVDEAKRLIQQGGAMDALLAELVGGATSQPGDEAAPAA